MTNGPPSPWRLLVHDILPSTQSLCRALAERGEPDGLVVQALQQSAGAGTHGRLWLSPPGNLSFSLLLRPGGAARRAGLWGMVAALATREALAVHTDGLRLKWPNDVLRDGAKIAGVLTEASARGDGIDWIVIGIGANLAIAPEVPDRATACLGADAPDPGAFAAAVLARIHTWRQRILHDGYAEVRAAWLEHGPAPGTHLTLRLGTREVGGSFAGLSDEGALLLATGGRIAAFAAGET